MRAKPARIMAEIRADYGLSVRDAWSAYRGFRDSITGKPSLAALGRNERMVRDLVSDIRGEDYEPEDFDSDYGYDWEVTGIYGE